MANYATLKAAIAAVIKQNGNNEITGNLLQQQLLAMVNSLGAGYQYVGVANQDTNPGTPDQNVFYIASTAGTYTNFGGLVLTDGEIAILKYNGAWSKDSTGAASLEKVNQLVQGYKYYGVAKPNTDPGTPEINVFYIASESGLYENFDNITVDVNEVCALVWDGTSWSKQVTGAAALNFVENREWLFLILDKDGKMLFGIRRNGEPAVFGKRQFTDNNFTDYFKELLSMSEVIDTKEWSYLVLDKEGKILFGTKTSGKFEDGQGKGLSTCDYTTAEKEIVSWSVIKDSPEFAFLLAKDNIPFFGVRKNGTLYPDIVGEFKAFKEDVLKHRIPFDTPLEETFVLPDTYSNVIATMYSYILEVFEEGGTSFFNFSKDLGKTWVVKPNPIGDITHTHIFSDGTFLLCGRRKVYTTKDFDTFTESVLYDADGSVINNLSRDSFFTLGHHDVYNEIDGKEVTIWGEYVLERNQNPKIWYTTDKGATLRSAFTFGVSMIDGTVINCRHIHKVTYCKKDNTFYAVTGDAYTDNEDNVMAGKLNVDNNSWEWKLIASGRMFKFGVPFFDDEFMYVITDYTEVLLAAEKGIIYTPISGLPQLNSDFSKFNYVYRYPVEDSVTETGLVMAPFDVVIDGAENKILFGDYQAYGLLWFAKKGFNFKRYKLSKKMLLGLNLMGPNFNGDIYTQAFGDGALYNNDWFKLNRGRGYNLTEIFRANGVEDFMKQLNTKYNF